MPYPAVALAEAHRILTAAGSPYETMAGEVEGRPMRLWKNAPATLRDVFRQGRGFGERTFLVYEDERATFEAFAKAAVVFAHELQCLGIAKGDRVAIAMRNLPEWPVAFFGAILAGAIAVPLNAWSTGPELEFMLNDSGARLAVADPERFHRIQPHLDACPALRLVLVSRAEQLDCDKAEAWEKLVGKTADWPNLPTFDLPEVDLAPDDDATIFYTSGTTGKPKGAHRHAPQRLFDAVRPPLRPGDGGAAARRDAADAGPERAAEVDAAVGALLPRHRLHVDAGPMPRLRLEDRDHAALGHGGGAQADRTRAHQRRRRRADHRLAARRAPDFAKYDTSSLESFGYGGAPAAADLVRRLKAAVPASLLGTAWGMTETSAPFTIISGEDYETRPTTCGYALPVGEIRIVGANGDDMPAGEAGELWVRGPMVVKGYWRNPEATEQTFGGGWLRTGDIAKLDDEGFCYIVDRAKDMLIRGGENIYCVEVENALAAHPDVIDAAVVGRPHRELGEEPVAVVTIKPSSTLTEHELRAFALHHIAAFKAPVKILLQRDMLPRNANGKILKRELRKMFVA